MTTTVVNAPMPIRRDLRMKRGADFRMSIIAKEDDRVTIKDTTDWDVLMTFKDAPNGEQYLQLAIGSGITNTPAEGRLAFEITNVNVDWTRAIYDIIIIDALGTRTCPFYGDVEVIQ
jgi:hypothetical protein